MSELNVNDVLEIHLKTWDMPTLANNNPEVIDWLAARAEVHFGMASEVIIVDKDTMRPNAYSTTDVRIALKSWLEGQLEDDEPTPAWADSWPGDDPPAGHHARRR